MNETNYLNLFETVTMRPTFSIIVPTYNRAHLIFRNIESVINQTYTNWELIIIDDGSTDNTRQVVESYKDQRIKYFWQENQERSIARNNGIKKARGEWVCFIDSDDWYKKNALELFNSCIEKNDGILALHGVIKMVDHLGNELHKTPCYVGTYSKQQVFVIETFGTLFNFCLHRSIVDKFRFEIINRWQDKEYIIRVLNETYFLSTKITIGYLLEHEFRSVKKPLSHDEAKKVVNVMSKTLHSAKHISTWVAYKAIVNWQRNMLYTHWHYYKDKQKYFFYLSSFAPYNILLWFDSLRILKS